MAKMCTASRLERQFATLCLFHAPTRIPPLCSFSENFSLPFPPQPPKTFPVPGALCSGKSKISEEPSQGMVVVVTYAL